LAHPIWLISRHILNILTGGVMGSGILSQKLYEPHGISLGISYIQETIKKYALSAHTCEPIVILGKIIIALRCLHYTLS